MENGIERLQWGRSGELLPNGLTQWGTASAEPLAVSPPYQRIVAFTGSAIAAG
jgi:hypothetical protein